MRSFPKTQAARYLLVPILEELELLQKGGGVDTATKALHFIESFAHQTQGESVFISSRLKQSINLAGEASCDFETNRVPLAQLFHNMFPRVLKHLSLPGYKKDEAANLYCGVETFIREKGVSVLRGHVRGPKSIESLRRAVYVYCDSFGKMDEVFFSKENPSPLVVRGSLELFNDLRELLEASASRVDTPDLAYLIRYAQGV